MADDALQPSAGVRRPTMTDAEIHIRTAVNLLRDAAESRRYPSGLTMDPDMVALHERAAVYLETMAKTHASMDDDQWAAEFPAANAGRDVRLTALLAAWYERGEAKPVEPGEMTNTSSMPSAYP
jgi:hypothetical protein